MLFRKLGKAARCGAFERKILHFACEFYRGVGWRITERETGLLTQNKYIPNKRALTEYINDKNFLAALLRITSTEYYETQKDELKQFLESCSKKA